MTKATDTHSEYVILMITIVIRTMPIVCFLQPRLINARRDCGPQGSNLNGEGERNLIYPT